MIRAALVFALIATSAAQTQSATELLTLAHASTAKLESKHKRTFLIEIIQYAERLEHQSAPEWIGEFDASLEEESNPCLKAEWQARLLDPISRNDAGKGVRRLHQAGGDCHIQTARSAASVFRQSWKQCGIPCVDDLMAAADHLGSLGAYPFSSVGYLYSQVYAKDPGLASSIFAQAVVAYRDARIFNWWQHAAVVYLLESAVDREPRAAVREAAELVLRRVTSTISVKDQKIPEVQRVSIQKGGATEAVTESQEVMARLFNVVRFDTGLQKKIREEWPGTTGVVPTLPDPEKFVSGVQVAGGRSVPKPLQLKMSVDRFLSTMGDSSLEELNRSQVGPGVKVGLYSNRAKNVCKKDPKLASEFFTAAERSLAKVEDPNDRIMASTFLAPVAAACERADISAAVLTNALELGIDLLKVESKEAPWPLTTSGVYYGLKKLVLAAPAERQAVVAQVRQIQDDTVRALLLLALVDAEIEGSKATVPALANTMN